MCRRNVGDRQTTPTWEWKVQNYQSETSTEIWALNCLCFPIVRISPWRVAMYQALFKQAKNNAWCYLIFRPCYFGHYVGTSLEFPQIFPDDNLRHNLDDRDKDRVTEKLVFNTSTGHNLEKFDVGSLATSSDESWINVGVWHYFGMRRLRPEACSWRQQSLPVNLIVPDIHIGWIKV